jgi:hypothetical protein
MPFTSGPNRCDDSRATWGLGAGWDDQATSGLRLTFGGLEDDEVVERLVAEVDALVRLVEHARSVAPEPEASSLDDPPQELAVRRSRGG